jgi:hypothetical protein
MATPAVGDIALATYRLAHTLVSPTWSPDQLVSSPGGCDAQAKAKPAAPEATGPRAPHAVHDAAHDDRARARDQATGPDTLRAPAHHAYKPFTERHCRSQNQHQRNC